MPGCQVLFKQDLGIKEIPFKEEKEPLLDECDIPE